MPAIEDVWDFGDPRASEERFVALAADAEGNEKAALLTQVARAQGLQQHFEDARKTLAEAEALIEGVCDASVRLQLEKGRIENSNGNPEGSQAFFHRALELAKEAENDFLAVDSAHMLGIACKGEKGLGWTVRAIELAEVSSCEKARAWLGSLYNNVGWSYHDLGRYDDALNYFQKALDSRERQGKDDQVRIAKWCVARCLRSLGRADEALSMQKRLLEEKPDGFVHEEIAECLLLLGRPEESRPHFGKAFDLLKDDLWLSKDEPKRLARLERLSR